MRIITVSPANFWILFPGHFLRGGSQKNDRAHGAGASEGVAHALARYIARLLTLCLRSRNRSSFLLDSPAPAMDHLKGMKETFLKTIEKIVVVGHHNMVCVQCHASVTSDKSLIARTEGLQLIFCSYQCVHNYWEECGQYGRSAVAPQRS